MTDETDFLELYGKLRLRPDCSLDEFRLAYRRYIAQWHPDRRSGERAQKLAVSRMQRIMSQYDAAMAFHRRHGRLPGAGLGAPPHRVVISPASRPADTSTPRQIVPVRQHMPRTVIALTVIAVMVLAYPLLSPYTRPPVDAVSADGAMPAPVSQLAHAAADDLRVGMSMDDVRISEGEPTRRGEQRWEYGASWVGFENGVVSDWYSSPWQPLHASTPRAPR